MKPLDQIGIECNTDKASFSHNYLQFYERFIGPWRDWEISLLEIGVGDGASLRMWEQYFPKAKIVGLEIEERKRVYAGRCIIEIGDQANKDFLRDVVAKHGPFDIIVDDGGHQIQQQLISLKALLPHVKSPGFYFLEDIIYDEVRDYIQDFCGGLAKDNRPFTNGDSETLKYCKFAAIMRGLFVVGT